MKCRGCDGEVGAEDAPSRADLKVFGAWCRTCLDAAAQAAKFPAAGEQVVAHEPATAPVEAWELAGVPAAADFDEPGSADFSEADLAGV